METVIAYAVGSVFDHLWTFIDWGLVGGVACIVAGVVLLAIASHLDTSEVQW